MDIKKPLGVICAMENEAALLIGALKDRTLTVFSGCTFYKGSLSGTPAVVVRCGVGKVNAARITQALIDRFEPAGVVNSGIAGGVGEGLHVGDVVIGTGLIQHDVDVTALGYAKGNLFEGEKTAPTVFCSDEKLCDLLKTSAAQAAPERGVHGGIIVSGDVFIAKQDTKKELRETFGALAAEMEGAAVAHTAHYAGVPFAVLRVVSDLADGTAPASFDSFEDETAHLSAEIICALAKRLAE